MGKTNADDLISGICNFNLCYSDDKNTKFIAVPHRVGLPGQWKKTGKNRQQLAKSVVHKTG